MEYARVCGHGNEECKDTEKIMQPRIANVLLNLLLALVLVVVRGVMPSGSA
jgi:hypothetical protein